MLRIEFLARLLLANGLISSEEEAMIIEAVKNHTNNESLLEEIQPCGGCSGDGCGSCE